MGSFVREATPSDYSLPPDLPNIWNYTNSGRANRQASPPSSSVSPVVIAVIGCLGAAFLIVSYYTMVAKFCRARRVFGRGRHGEDFDDADEQNIVVWPIFARGLHDSVIRAIPVCKYSKSDGLVNCSECAVCLSEFEEEESLRLLPKCNHAFHLRCIDMWLQSNSNCPLCRASIVTSIPHLIPPTPVPEAEVMTAVGQNSAQVAHALQEEMSEGTQNNLDQRGSGLMADDNLPSYWYRVFTGEGEESSSGDEMDAKSEDRGWSRTSSSRKKICSKVAEGMQLPSVERSFRRGLRCFSTGRALTGMEEGRVQDEYLQFGQVFLPISRSSSVGTCSKLGGKLERSRRNQWSSVTLCQDVAAESPRLLTSSSSVRLNVGLNNATGSTSSSGPLRVLKSRSVSHGTVKRSFSGGRLFGFRMKSIGGTANTRLPV